MINFNQFYQRNCKSKGSVHRPNTAYIRINTPKQSQEYSQSLLGSYHSQMSQNKYRKKHQNAKVSTRTHLYTSKGSKKQLQPSVNKDKYKYQVLNLHCIKRLQIQNPCIALSKIYHNKQLNPLDLRKKKEDRARQKEFLGRKLKCLVNRSTRAKTEALDPSMCDFAVEGFKIV